ncbi:site-specific integrase [Lysinibacillus xylanilyticus]|uniref:site-specific integrase n=1 Tax=Lysinibacillus xylanilyticus TaxID=582475 RepID=UPI0038275C42
MRGRIFYVYQTFFNRNQPLYVEFSAKGLSPKTLRSYEQTLKLFARYLLDNFEIDDVKNIRQSYYKLIYVQLKKEGSSK